MPIIRPSDLELHLAAKQMTFDVFQRKGPEAWQAAWQFAEKNLHRRYDDLEALARRDAALPKVTRLERPTVEDWLKEHA